MRLQTTISRPIRSATMASIKRSDTKPEAALRSTLHANGLRFRRDYPIRLDRRSVRLDVVFARGSVAAFVDGCLRHVCLEQRRRRKSTVEFCDHKLGANQERDRLQTSPLRKWDGQLIPIWERAQLESAVATVLRTVAPAGLVFAAPCSSQRRCATRDQTQGGTRSLHR